VTNPHFNLKTISRSDGTWFSAVKAASYISGERLYDAKAKEYANYGWRKDVAHSEILAPEGTPDYLLNRQTLWNKVEESENRKDSQLARSLVIGMPHELNHQERVELLQGYVKENFVSKGMIADIALHKPDLEKSADERHHHAHILLTLRQADKDGLYRTKTREWNSKDNAIKWRKSWADHQNQSFERKGLVLQVDERTLKPKHEMVYGEKNFPPQFQFKLKPEIPMGRKDSPDFAKRLRENKSILDENMGTVEALHDKADARLNEIDRMKARLKKQERESQHKHVSLRKPHDPEFKNIGQTVQQIKGASRRHQRLRFLAKKSDEHFQLMIYLHGFKTALAHRKQDLHKLEKNLHYIDYLGDKLERFFHKMEEQEQERERRGQPARKVDPSKQPTTAQKLKIKDPKMEKAKDRRRRKRKFPF
jgi:hypothetical protein